MWSWLKLTAALWLIRAGLKAFGWLLVAAVAAAAWPVTVAAAAGFLAAWLRGLAADPAVARRRVVRCR